MTFEPRPEDVRNARALQSLICATLELGGPKHAWSLAAAIRYAKSDTILAGLRGEDLEPLLVALQVDGVVRRFKGYGGEPMYELVRRPPRPVRIGVDWRGERVRWRK